MRSLRGILQRQPPHFGDNPSSINEPRQKWPIAVFRLGSFMPKCRGILQESSGGRPGRPLSTTRLAASQP
jgi:hypothetical protein